MPAARRAQSAPPFESIYRHGYARVAVATPRVEVASPAFNAAQTLALARQAAAAHCVLALFPELGLSAYSNEDLFQQDALLDASLEALRQVVEASRALPVALAVGLPLQADGRLHNCGVVVHRGRVLGAVPKSYLPNYREFYEKRQFAPGAQALATSIRLFGQDVPFGSQLLFAATNLDGFVLQLEICEDLWVPLPPSTLARTRRRDGDREPVGERHHRRQGGLPAPDLRLAVGEVRGRLSLLSRRPGRVDDRSRLGRTRAGLRERRAAGRIAALPAASPA